MAHSGGPGDTGVLRGTWPDTGSPCGLSPPGPQRINPASASWHGRVHPKSPSSFSKPMVLVSAAKEKYTLMKLGPKHINPVKVRLHVYQTTVTFGEKQ